MICTHGRDASDRLATVLIVLARQLDNGADPAFVGAALELTSRHLDGRGCSHAIHAAEVLNRLAVALEIETPADMVALMMRLAARAERADSRPPLTAAEVEATAALLDADDANLWAVLGIRADGAP